jgi:hypothetical protein
VLSPGSIDMESSSINHANTISRCLENFVIVFTPFVPHERGSQDNHMELRTVFYSPAIYFIFDILPIQSTSIQDEHEQTIFQIDRCDKGVFIFFIIIDD